MTLPLGTAPVRIWNRTSKTWVASRARIARSHVDRLRGLLGRTQFARGEGLWISPCKAVHTWFMRFAIDLAFLDREGTIVQLIPDVVPFRVSPIVRRAHSVLELPAGTIAECHLQVGDRLQVQSISSHGRGSD